jgi:hypothetical protein
MRKQLLMTEVPVLLLIFRQQAPLNLALKTLTATNLTAPTIRAVVRHRYTEINVRPNS